MDSSDGNLKDSIGMEAKILSGCPIGRYKEGEIGTVLPNDFEKYDYKIELSPVEASGETGFFKKGQLLSRVYYFYDNQIEILNSEEREDEEESFGPRR